MHSSSPGPWLVQRRYRWLISTSQRAAGESRVGSSPQQVVTLPNGTTGLGVSRGPGILAGFDSRGSTVSPTIRVGTNPHGLAGSRVARTASVAHEGAPDVSVVEGASSTVTATVHGGNALRMIVVQPGAGGQGMIPVLIAQSLTHGTMPICDHGTLEVQG
jgi:hypothetical protein